MDFKFLNTAVFRKYKLTRLQTLESFEAQVTPRILEESLNNLVERRGAPRDPHQCFAILLKELRPKNIWQNGLHFTFKKANCSSMYIPQKNKKVRGDQHWLGA